MSTQLSVEKTDEGGFVVYDTKRGRSVHLSPGLLAGDFNVEVLHGEHRVIKLVLEAETSTVAILFGEGKVVQRFAPEFLASESKR